MAITIVEQPADYHAAYNPIIFEIDSDNKTEPGFRYIIRIHNQGDLLNSVVEFKAAPDPTIDNRSRFDISSYIQSRVDKFLDITSTGVEQAVGTYYNYDIKFGESYNHEWDYQDYVYAAVYVGGDTAFTSDSALIGSGTDIPHGYSIGDQIYSSSPITYGDDRDLLKGYFTVIGVVSPLTVVIDIDGISDSGGAAIGTTRYSDFRKEVDYNLASVLDIYAINAAQDVVEYGNSQGDLSDYIVDGPTQRFLTNCNKNGKFFATETQLLFVNMMPADTSTFKMFFENDGGDIFYKANNDTLPVISNSIGPGNLGTLTLESGTAILVKPETKYYDVWVGELSGTPESEKLRIYIDRRCKINTTEILFMDRMGSFMSFAFQNREFESITVNRETYRKYVANITPFSDGVETYKSDITKRLSVNANFMDESMNIYYEELFTSRYTFVKYEGVWYSCTVRDTSLNNERSRNTKLIRKSLIIDFDNVSIVN